MRFNYIVILIFLSIFLSIFVKKSSITNIDGLDIAASTLCESAALHNRTEIIEKIIPYLKNPVSIDIAKSSTLSPSSKGILFKINL